MNVYLYIYFTSYGVEDFNVRFVTEEVHKYVYSPFPDDCDERREQLPAAVIEALPTVYGETYSEDDNFSSISVGSTWNDRALSCHQLFNGVYARFKTVTEAFAFAEENGLCIIGAKHWLIY